MNQIVEYGFARDRAITALANTNGSFENAMQYCVDNSEQSEQWWQQQHDQRTVESQPTVWEALTTLQGTDDRTFSSASRVLLRVINNCINNPNEPRFRTLRLDNPRVQKDVVQAPGALPALLAVGWKEKYSTKDGTVLTLPSEADLEAILELRDALQASAVARDLPIQPEPSSRAAATPQDPRPSQGGGGSQPEGDEFVRDEFEEVGATQVAEINAFCRTNDTHFIDDQCECLLPRLSAPAPCSTQHTTGHHPGMPPTLQQCTPTHPWPPTLLYVILASSQSRPSTARCTLVPNSRRSGSAWSATA